MSIYIPNYVKYLMDFYLFKKKSDNRFKLNFFNKTPCLEDNTKNTSFDTHYIYHPAWAARIIKEINPRLHIDISSTLHFCSILSAFIPIKFYDYRPAKIHLSNLESLSANLTKLFFEDESIESLSCMHTIEHIGLGRYGDPIDPSGDIKAIKELKRVVKKGGNLLFVVPIGGTPEIIFNSHRTYTFDQIILFFKEFELKKFSLVPNQYPNTNFIENATKQEADDQTFGCGCFWFIKK